jgi:hypothetical protein
VPIKYQTNDGKSRPTYLELGQAKIGRRATNPRNDLQLRNINWQNKDGTDQTEWRNGPEPSATTRQSTLEECWSGESDGFSIAVSNLLDVFSCTPA